MLTIRQTVAASTPEQFRALLVEQCELALAQVADAHGMGELAWSDVEVIAENLFEFVLEDVTGKQVRATIELTPVVVQ
jgi:hypothetical protein